jgi:hypothetical protein
MADELCHIKILQHKIHSCVPSIYLNSTHLIGWNIICALHLISIPPMIWQWSVHRPYTSLPNSTHAYQLVTSDFQFIENQAGRMFSNIHSTETHFINSLITSYLCNSIAPQHTEEIIIFYYYYYYYCLEGRLSKIIILTCYLHSFI